MVARTGDYKSNNWEDDNIDFANEEYGCKRSVSQRKGRAWGGNSHGSVCTTEGNDQEQDKYREFTKEKQGFGSSVYQQ